MMSTVLSMMALILLNSWNLTILILPILVLLNTLNLYSPSNSYTCSSPLFMTDNMSCLMIMLTLWITTIMMISSSKINNNKMKEKKFNQIVLTLCLLLILAFSMNNLFTFYIFFEASLIPPLLLILMWGYQPERLQAGMYMMMYTISASLPLLLGIIYLLYTFKSVSFIIFYPPMKTNFILNLSLTMAFLVKLPIYTLHLWLPKAHVEAPVAGSMILAGVLLKLGGYGLFRLFLGHPQILKNSTLLMAVSLWGALVTTILCLRQLDMKLMIAYSSISHMALVIAGIYSNSMWGWNGAMMMMLAHGLSSSGLFALANMYYENTHTRSLFITKGMLFISPSMTLWWILMIAANMASPPTINLLAEIMLFMSIFCYSHLTMVILILISFFTMSYSLILYTSLHHGPPSEHLMFFNSLQIYFSINFLHTVPLFCLIICPDLMICWT